MDTNEYKLDLFSSKLLKTTLILVDRSNEELNRKISGYIKIAEAYSKLKQNNDAALVMMYIKLKL